jgi:hypothetical protein
MSNIDEPFPAFHFYSGLHWKQLTPAYMAYLTVSHGHFDLFAAVILVLSAFAAFQPVS